MQPSLDQTDASGRLCTVFKPSSVFIISTVFQSAQCTSNGSVPTASENMRNERRVSSPGEVMEFCIFLKHLRKLKEYWKFGLTVH